MYSGSNPSAVRSMDFLRNAFLKLLKSNSYEKITIKDICREADISRQTFYQAFHSKEEILEWHFASLFAEFEKENFSFENNSVKSIAYAFFDFFYEHRDFVKILTDNNLSWLLEKQFEKYLKKIELFTANNDKETYPDYTVSFIAGALTQILIHWFDRSFSVTAEELSGLVEGILTGKPIERKVT